MFSGGRIAADSLRVETCATGEETRGYDATVIEDEQVAGLKVLREVEKMLVGDCSGGAVEGQHARGGAVGKRLLRDLLCGKSEVVV